MNRDRTWAVILLCRNYFPFGQAAPTRAGHPSKPSGSPLLAKLNILTEMINAVVTLKPSCWRCSVLRDTARVLDLQEGFWLDQRFSNTKLATCRLSNQKFLSLKSSPSNKTQLPSGFGIRKEVTLYVRTCRLGRNLGAPRQIERARLFSQAVHFHGITEKPLTSARWLAESVSREIFTNKKNTQHVQKPRAK